MTAIRTYAGRPASLLTVVLAAAITLALAVSVALMVSDDVSAPSTAGSVTATPAAASSAPREGVLTPRVTETPSVPSGVRYDGGPEEGTRGIHRGLNN
jgi:hypothetical protein